MITEVNHIQITVPSLEEQTARDFYCGLLELKEIEKPEVLRPNGGFWLQLGKIQIHVGVEDSIDRYQTKAHIGYEVSNLRFWRGKLQSADIEIIDAKPIPGLNRFEFRDPFGNRVELLEVV